MSNAVTVLTVREAVRKSKQEGLPVSEHALRMWIRAGVIPVRKVGTKILIYYPNLVRYLQCEDGADNEPATVAAAAGIRRVDL